MHNPPESRSLLVQNIGPQAAPRHVLPRVEAAPAARRRFRDATGSQGRHQGLRVVQRAAHLLFRSGTAARPIETTERPGLTLEFRDYPAEPRPRHGWGSMPHRELTEIIQRNDAQYRQLLAGFAHHSPGLGRIPQGSADETDPVWRNSYFEGLDVVALYSLLADRNPRNYVEIGSGFSTRVARRAIQDHGLRTQVLAVDPNPRTSIARIADDTINEALEELDLKLFDALGPGDFLFFDGSHRVFTNSDATVFFTEVLPRLRPGVIVHVHDVFLPWDYIPGWRDRWYSEQYLLSAWLLAGDRARILLPSFYISLRPELHHVLDPVFDQFIWSGMVTNGSSFWFEMVG